MKRSLLCALVAVVVCALAWAADDPTGTWKWTTEVNGQKRENTLKLKLEGEKLTGALVGRNNQETAIDDGKYKDGDLSFKVTRDRNGQKITSKYSGKLSGDTIKGKIETDVGGQTRDRDWEAKREKA